ncbi:hypothetical protein Ptr902_13045 [Pyrenophora tritici-repentis]|nr:hypothetical protein Ptr902_13045 [Pyrenophora tritici-repentis]
MRYDEDRPLDIERVRRAIREHPIRIFTSEKFLEKSEALDQESKIKASATALGKVLLANAKPDCLAFATSFHPPSVDIQHEFPDTWPPNHDPNGVLIDELSIELFQERLQHWFLPEAVGFEFAHECAKNYFEEIVFLFNVPSIRSIKSFLEEDIFGLELKPSEHIRRCRIDITNYPVSGDGDSESSRALADQLVALCRLKQACSMVDFILDVYVTNRKLATVNSLLNHLIWLSPILCKSRRRKISFTVKLTTDEGPEAFITPIWFRTSKASKRDNGSLDSNCHDDTDGKALLQRFLAWKEKLRSGVVHENMADDEYLSYLTLIDFDPDLIDFVAAILRQPW